MDHALQNTLTEACVNMLTNLHEAFKHDVHDAVLTRDQRQCPAIMDHVFRFLEDPDTKRILRNTAQCRTLTPVSITLIRNKIEEMEEPATRVSVRMAAEDICDKNDFDYDKKKKYFKRVSRLLIETYDDNIHLLCQPLDDIFRLAFKNLGDTNGVINKAMKELARNCAQELAHDFCIEPAEQKALTFRCVTMLTNLHEAFKEDVHDAILTRDHRPGPVTMNNVSRFLQDPVTKTILLNTAQCTTLTPKSKTQIENKIKQMRNPATELSVGWHVLELQDMNDFDHEKQDKYFKRVCNLMIETYDKNIHLLCDPLVDMFRLALDAGDCEFTDSGDTNYVIRQAMAKLASNGGMHLAAMMTKPCICRLCGLQVSPHSTL